MTVVIPLLPQYAFIAWEGTIILLPYILFSVTNLRCTAGDPMIDRTGKAYGEV
jgi:hypothetical protein